MSQSQPRQKISITGGRNEKRRLHHIRNRVGDFAIRLIWECCAVLPEAGMRDPFAPPGKKPRRGPTAMSDFPGGAA